MLDELIKIMNYDGSNPDIQEYIEELQDTELTEQQEELIFEIAALSYEIGKEEKCLD